MFSVRRISSFGKSGYEWDGVFRLNARRADTDFFDGRAGDALKSLGDAADAGSAMHAFDGQGDIAHVCIHLFYRCGGEGIDAKAGHRAQSPDARKR